MKKTTTLLKSLLIAAGLFTGTSTWATVEPFTESYNSSSTTDGWTTSITDRYTPVILQEGDNYFLSVDQSARNNNGATVTGTIINGKAAAGDDFTLLFDLRLVSHTDSSQPSTSFIIQDATPDEPGVMFSLTDSRASSYVWYINGTNVAIALPVSTTSTDERTSTQWYSFRLTRSGLLTYLTITNKETGTDILPKTIIAGSSSTGGLGNIVFNSSRYYANFAIDNIVVREVQSDDVFDGTPTTCTVKFQDTSGKTIKDDETFNTISGIQVTASTYLSSFIKDEKKYIYDSGNNPITVDEDASKNVITLVFREAETWDYAIYAYTSDDGQLQTITEGKQYEGESKKAYFPKAFNKEGIWYQTTPSSSSYYGVTLYDIDNYRTANILYSKTTDIDYYFECEDMTIIGDQEDGTLPERASNGGSVRLLPDAYLLTTTLSGGVYALKLNCSKPNSGTAQFDIMLWNGETLTPTDKSIYRDQGNNYTESEVTGITVPDGMALALKNNGNTDNLYNRNLNLDYIILKRIDTATIGTTGYTTFSSSVAHDLDKLPEGLTAYYVSNIEGNSVVLTKATGQVTAYTGLILAGTAGTYDIPVATSGSNIENNLLVGCIWQTNLPSSEELYVLADNNGTAEFQSLAKNGATIPAGKAYLNASYLSENARALNIVFADETTGIAEVKNINNENETIYNLNGQRVILPSKGFYVINGKKVVIK